MEEPAEDRRPEVAELEVDDQWQSLPRPIVPEKLLQPHLKLDHTISLQPELDFDKLVASEQPFFDESFPSSPQHFELPDGRKLVWKRITELFPNACFTGKNGVSPQDVMQGEMGDCWLIGAISVLACEEQYLEVVCPMLKLTQLVPLKGPPVTAFRFRFWKWGQWLEVVVDDRLPFLAGADRELQQPPKLAFARSRRPLEFWGPLLEKAYAKLHGSYDALDGGSTADAMVDFTGGVCEQVDMRTLSLDCAEDLKGNPDFDSQLLWKKLKRAKENGFLLGCSNKRGNRIRYGQLNASEHGIVLSHAYSVVDVKTVKIKGLIPGIAKETHHLLYIRNPWGNDTEWNGPWSDNSKEWSALTSSQKKKLGLTFEPDGSFWMAFQDFLTCFTHVDVCRTINTQFLSLNHRWRRHVFMSQWERPGRAGGCINEDTWYQNPQYVIDICKQSSMTISLMQMDPRYLRWEVDKKIDLDSNVIGFMLFKVENNRAIRAHRIPRNKIGGPKVWSNTREQVVHAADLLPGRYLVVPTTFEPGVSGLRFILRIFTEHSAKCKELVRESPKKGLIRGLPMGCLSVEVISVTGLKSLSLLHTAPTPFVEVEAAGKSYKTKNSKGLTTPFKQGFMFFFHKHPLKTDAEVVFNVWHSGTVLNTFMGQARVVLNRQAHIFSGGPDAKFQATLSLRARDSDEGDDRNVTGVLSVAFNWVTDMKKV